MRRGLGKNARNRRHFPNGDAARHGLAQGGQPLSILGQGLFAAGDGEETHLHHGVTAQGAEGADNRYGLEEAGYFDLIMYKASRGHPLSEAQRTVNRAISRARGSVERAFGSMKKHYGLARARYLGVAKMGMQLMLSAMAFNLKKAA